MIPLLTYPLALLAAISIPTLVSIYYFRNRFKRHNVAGLFLWEHAARAREGGTVIRRMRTSWLFLLELIALIALVVAATDPRLPFRHANRSLVVVLDDSASMLAGKDGDQPRDRALADIHRLVRAGRFRSVRFIQAGMHPTLLDIAKGIRWNDPELLAHWTCKSPASDLDGAIAMASEVTGRHARMLVVTDHAPSMPPEEGGVQWHAFGTALPNLGFVNARRSQTTGKDRLFLAVGNYTDNRIGIALPVVEAGTAIKTARFEVDAGKTASATFTLPPNTGAISVQLPRDALTIDNQIVLLPETHRKVGTRIVIEDEVLNDDIRSAVESTGLCDLHGPTHLLITDKTDSITRTETWQLRLAIPEMAKAYAGPFVVDFNNPITRGLSFAGIIWGASETNCPPGKPIVLAGNIPLLTEQAHASGKRVFTLQISPSLSNIQSTPTWPALIWNVVKLRSDALPGTPQVNVTAGTVVDLSLPANATVLTEQSPSGELKQITPHSAHAIFQPTASGIYTLTAETLKTQIAVNFISPQESDLSRRQSGTWGNWHDPETLAREYLSWAWVAGLLAILALSLHAILTARRSSNGEVQS
jgi:hypothetical protein